MIGALGWVADGVDYSERDTLETLERMIRIAARYETVARALLDMVWVADGVSDSEVRFIEYLYWLADSSVAVAENVLTLPRVDDGVSDTDVWFIDGLYGIARSSQTAAESVIDLAWITDGVSDGEVQFIAGLALIAHWGTATAESVLALTWVTDGVSDSEARFTNILGGLAFTNADMARQVMGMPFLQDGASDSEADFTLGMTLIAGSSAATAERVLALTWIADGVSDSEADFTVGLGSIAREGAAVAESVLALTWVADGVSDIEAGVAIGLGNIALTDADAALQVMDMPFLQTLESADVPALNSLGRMDSDKLADVLSRPMLKDGITDDEAPIVSMLGGDPDVYDKLLDPDTIAVERRTVELPLAGEVDLVIVRTRPGAKRSMDLLENAVREAENLMGEPLPVRYGYVGLLVENAVTDESFIGEHLGSYMVILPEFDADDGSPAADFSPFLIAHEVAHYYWADSDKWINEGMANTIAGVIENRRVGRPLYDLADADCRFASLLRTLGEDAFWDGAGSLYNQSRGVDISIEDIRQAFGADDVIARWRGTPEWC